VQGSIVDTQYRHYFFSLVNCARVFDELVLMDEFYRGDTLIYRLDASMDEFGDHLSRGKVR